jgi:hypothetical protein
LLDDPFIALCAMYVIARTLLVGVVVGWFAHRFVVSAWIPLLACAAATASLYWPRGYSPARTADR